ncbi:MAG: alpha-L-fucosidase [Bacteroidaceae bacterium]
MKKIIAVAALFGCLLTLSAQEKEPYYVKHLTFPEGSSLEQKVDMASRLVPSAQQLAWQKMELTAFLHFGINTFTGKEWGDGTENPELFNPTELNAEQWVLALKAAGFKMAMITAKHHDGFCLWPTKTTKHSVASSPWKEGKGDVVRELKNACDKYGMKFGVYLSPWDRNASCYGDSPKYNQFFIAQLTELLTNYGEVHEVWFDGANGEGPNGKKQVYDWDLFYKTITQLQPKAVMAIMGDDVRWVGNEKGVGRETEWGATALTPGIYSRSTKQNKQLELFEKAKDLGGRDVIDKANELFWYPSEVDVSIRPGWFYHQKQDKEVKSLSKLADIYFQSVGYNSVLLLNIPPDKRGLIHENDVKRLKELSDYLAQTFEKNFVKKGSRLWKASTGQQKVYRLQKRAFINTVLLQEDISKGQRVEGFTLETKINGVWKPLAKGTTIGLKRLMRFSDCQTEELKLTINGSRGKSNIINVGAYYAKPLEDEQKNQKVSDIPVAAWKVTSPNLNPEAGKAIDGNLKTYWKSEAMLPLVVDLGKAERITGFTYAPIDQEDKSGTIYTYNFYVSQDGKSWTKCDCSGEFSNIKNNPIPQFVNFGKEYTASYFKLEPLSEIDNKAFVTISEIGLLSK